MPRLANSNKGSGGLTKLFIIVLLLFVFAIILSQWASAIISGGAI